MKKINFNAFFDALRRWRSEFIEVEGRVIDFQYGTVADQYPCYRYVLLDPASRKIFGCLDFQRRNVLSTGMMKVVLRKKGKYQWIRSCRYRNPVTEEMAVVDWREVEAVCAA